jgi:hypothetical protein
MRGQSGKSGAARGGQQVLKVPQPCSCVVQCSAVQYSAVQCSAVQCSVAQFTVSPVCSRHSRDIEDGVEARDRMVGGARGRNVNGWEVELLVGGT